MNDTARELLAVAKDIVAWGGLPPMTRDNYLPRNVELKKVEIPDLPALEVYTYERMYRDGVTPILCGIAFYGKGQKPIWNFSFRNEGDRQRRIDETVKQYKSWEERKQKRQQERKEYKHDLKVGDILVSSWGYDQTNISWYQVVEISEKTVKIQEIGSKSAQGNNVVPIKGNFVGQPMLKKVLPSKSIRITSFAYAHPWNGEPRYETPLGEGH